jgi:zinc-finger of transposase IS204/IS1001/IS1096/IS1165
MMVEAMKVEAFLGLPEGLEVVCGDIADQVITLTIISTQQHPLCPLCENSASRVHSHNRRQLTDMSCAGRRVRLILHVRKFFCDERCEALEKSLPSASHRSFNHGHESPRVFFRQWRILVLRPVGCSGRV